MVVWRKGHLVLAAGPTLTTPDKRFKLHTGAIHSGHNRLEVRNIRPQDAGDYVCQISTLGKTIEVAHTVEVLGR